MATADHWYVQPVVVSAGILISLGVAAHTISTNRKIARQKATMDMMEGRESKEYYQRLYFSFRQFKCDEEFRAKVLNPTSEDERKDRHRCFEFLNHYELVAIGIERGILEEEFYRMWMEFFFLEDWRSGRALIRAAREQPTQHGAADTAAYRYMEALAVKWGAAPLAGAPLPWYRRPPGPWT